MADGRLEELLESIDFGAWLDREGIDYRERRGSSGPQFNLKECPFCGNEKWKVYVGQESGIGHCHRCERNFGKWSFVKQYLGDPANPKIVVDHLEQCAREQGWRAPRKVAVATTLPELALPKSVALPVNGRNLRYLQNRGIFGDVARYFGLRYCHQGKFDKQSYDRRVIIPVFDLDGNMVSFQGRDITGTSERKYLFPAGFASTGAHLYNGHNVHHTKRIVVGEGVFDVIALKCALDRDPQLRDVIPVGTFGKHMSHGDADSQQAKFLELKARGVEQVTFMWDSEPAALKAAIEAGNRLKSFGLVVRIALLPPGKDPNECDAETVCKTYWSADVLTNAIATKMRLKLGAGT